MTLLGFVSYKNLSVELYPNSELPVLMVRVSSQVEVDPSYMENQAIIPLEGAVTTLAGIQQIESFANQRQGTIYIYYTQNTQVTQAYLKLEEKINEARSSLPEGLSASVIRMDTDQIANEFMRLQVRGGGGVDRVRNIVDQKITARLEAIDGIANVEVFGGREKSVEIILDAAACKAYRLTGTRIRNLIRQNSQEKASIGRVFGSDHAYFVNVTAEFSDISDLENIVVSAQGPVRLRDIAEIFYGVKTETSLSRINGKDAVTMTLVRDAQVNQIQLSHAAKAVIDRLNQDLHSQDIEIVIQSNSAETMETNISLIMQLAALGGCFAVFILWIFLRNLRLVLIISLAIPISILTAMNFFYLFHISINSLTLVGLALAIGMLLDNSVVVLENIYRLAAEGKTPDDAVIQGTREVWKSIFASTLTTITVFMPFLFSSNYMVKLIGHHIGISIISTLLVSLLVALLLIPMATHFYLKRKSGEKGSIFQHVSQKNGLIQKYLVLIKSSIRFPARTLLGAVVVFFVSILVCLALSLNTTREVESTELTLYVTMPGGATLESTDLVTQEIEEKLKGIEEIQDITSRIYEEEAIITTGMKENFTKIKGRSIAQVKSEIQDRMKEYAAAEVGFDQPSSSSRFRGGGRSNPGASFQRMLGIGSQTEKIVIRGRDFTQMRNVANDIVYYLENLSTIQSAGMNISDTRPEVHLVFDTHVMSLYDIALSDVTSELGTFETQFSSGLTFKQGGEEYDISIRNDVPEEEANHSLPDLQTLSIPGPDGSSFELQDLSRIVFSSGLAEIHRVNQEKEIEVTYSFLSEINTSKPLLEAARETLGEVIAGLSIPAGIAVEVVHEETNVNEYYFLIAAAFILIYMILAAVFESLVIPVVMMFTIPLAAIGSFWALILTGHSLLNANTLTGFLILLGVVVNNGIILIDYSKILQKRGYTRSRALMMAGQARIRPIFITTITTIVGMFPLAMGKAEYVTNIGAPFAITVVGGLAVSALCTLIFIPTFYSGIESALEWLRKLPLRVKLLQAAAFTVASLLIFRFVDDLVWKSAALFLAVVLIPGMTYFFMNSLRQARSRLIRPDEPIVIRVQNLVKIYDREKRFVREWKKGKTIRMHAGLDASIARMDFQAYLWQLPLLAFLLYFVYVFIAHGFWEFVLCHAVYFYLLYLIRPLPFLLSRFRKNRAASFLERHLYSLFLWFFPMANLILFQLQWKKWAIVLLIGFVWYAALVIYATSNALHSKNVNIARISGRFAGLRRGFYRLVQVIPVIGKKKEPFRALSRISLEIGNGMFGLLGPNGAGKTTLMRIICGILEQSHGKIWFNSLDSIKHREELQGLIGYLPQEFGTYENMTAAEFLHYQAILKNIMDRESRMAIVEKVLAAVHMSAHKNEKIGSFSGGMKQRIGIAQILLHLPRILVVDEPTAGLDPRERIRFRNLLVELSKDRIVIFSTHIIEDISSSCNRVAVLNRGELKYAGEPPKMAKMARGHVWQFNVPADSFEGLSRELLIVHHMRDQDRIRVRCLAEKKPHPLAKSVDPTLEDAYLWLLTTGRAGKGKNENES